MGISAIIVRRMELASLYSFCNISIRESGGGNLAGEKKKIIIIIINNKKSTYAKSTSDMTKSTSSLPIFLIVILGPSSDSMVFLLYIYIYVCVCSIVGRCREVGALLF